MKVEQNELSIYEAETFHKELLSEFENDKISIDISNVNTIDMCIIQLLVSMSKSCQEKKKDFALLNVNDEVKNILKSCGCDFLLGANDG